MSYVKSNALMDQSFKMDQIFNFFEYFLNTSLSDIYIYQRLIAAPSNAANERRILR